MKRANRLLALADYPFAKWGARVEQARRRGLDVIRLDVGDPDLPPPENVIATLNRSAQQPDHHGYPGYRGLASLREAAAAYYDRRYGVVLDPDTQVLPLLGSKEGIINLALGCLNPGDLALVPDPAYAPYAIGAVLAGAEVHRLPLRPDRDWTPDLDGIPSEVLERAALLWLNYPNNPTGAAVDLAFLEHAVGWARRHRLLLCHDAAYADVAYDGTVVPSVLQVPGALDTAVEFTSCSKSWNMAGWRVGLAAGNPGALAVLGQVKTNVDSGIFRPVQEAAAQALATDPAWIDQRNRIYGERMALLVDGAAEAGLACARPRASLYLWARLPDLWKRLAHHGTSVEYAGALLDSTGVAVAPGTFFGPGGEGYVRLSVTAPTGRIREAMERLRRARF